MPCEGSGFRVALDTSNFKFYESQDSPPHSVEAERSVLGCCLLDKAALLSVINAVRPDDFHIPRHRYIYTAITNLFNSNVTPDYISLTSELMTTGKLEDSGGADYIAGLTNVVPSVRNADHYATIVEELAQLRRISRLGQEMHNDVGEGKLRLRDILDKSTGKFLELATERDRKSYSSIGETTTEWWSRYMDRYNKDDPEGIQTGYTDLDNFTYGFQPGNLIILAARPSEGKTSLALDFARNISIQSNLAVAFVSLEMTRDEIAMRLICSTSEVDSSKLRRKKLEDKPDDIGLSDYDRIGKAIGILNKAKLFVDDTPSVTITELRAKIKAIKLEHGLDIVIVDYLQLIDGEMGGGDVRVQEVSRISRGLKSLARELQVPVLALSQLSRNLEHREGKKRVPRLSDLRESGAIEQDADLVMFIHRDIDEEEESQMTRYEGPSVQDTQLIVAKNRNGSTGIVQLEFFKTIFTFKQSTEPPVKWRRENID